MSQEPKFTLIDPETFHNKKFSVDSFLVSLTKDVIGPSSKGNSAYSGTKDALSANEQVKRVQRLLGVLERCVACQAQRLLQLLISPCIEQAQHTR